MVKHMTKINDSIHFHEFRPHNTLISVKPSTSQTFLPLSIVDTRVFGSQQRTRCRNKNENKTTSTIHLYENMGDFGMVLLA